MNAIGEGPPTTKSVDLLNQEACPAQASAGILILIVLIIVFLLAFGLGAFFLYKKKLLCFDGEHNYMRLEINSKVFFIIP